MSVAIIGGTGLCELPGLDIVCEHEVETPLGKTSSPILEGRYHGSRVYFLARHGREHSIAPHLINYRANLWALKSLGVDSIVAVNAVGGIDSAAGPEALVIPDQIIDYTSGRAHTYYTGEDVLKEARVAGLSFAALDHIDFTFPYSKTLREQLLGAAVEAGLGVLPQGVYGCTQGPRLETAAEVLRCQRDGCAVVGMTGMPEAALARELQMEYASVCLVVNWGAGLTNDLITMDDIRRVIGAGMAKVEVLIAALLMKLVPEGQID